jgi:SAM-dependent methyltransferase
VPTVTLWKTFKIARNVKLFLRLNAGISHGVVPDPVQEKDRQIRVQARQLEQMKKLLPEKSVQRALWEAAKNHTQWEAAKVGEVEWWQNWLATQGDDWPWEYPHRLEPEQPLQDRIISYLNTPPGAEASILDVGAGPLTTLGKRWEERTVRITAVDPLASEYKRILDQAGITPPVPTQPGEVERLTELFPSNHFDLVHMQNALDHSYDPLVGIRQMLEVVKPGGYVLLLHDENEAHRQNYSGFHLWNFCAENGHFTVWNRETRISVNDAMDNIAEITVDDSGYERGYDKPVFVSLKKK